MEKKSSELWKALGPREGHSGDGEKRSGPRESRSGITEKHSGPRESRSGITEKRSGSRESRSGPAEKRSDPKENCSGTTENCPYSHKSHSNPCHSSIFKTEYLKKNNKKVCEKMWRKCDKTRFRNGCAYISL